MSSLVYTISVLAAIGLAVVVGQKVIATLSTKVGI